MDTQPRQRPVAAVLSAVAALVVALAFAATAQAADGGFSARPSKGSPHDKADTYFTLSGGHGEVLHETLIISNLSNHKKHFLIDAVDGLTGVTSGSVYANRDDPKRRAGTWVSVADQNLTVPAHREVLVPVTITIPAVARAGDHLAGLAVQDAHVATSTSKFSIKQIVRVVVGMQIVVKGSARPQIALGSIQMAALPGTKVPSVVVELTDTGRKLCKPLLHVSVANPTTRLQVVTRRLDTILPGTSIKFPMPWPNPLKAGTYTVKARATHCGAVTATSASARLGTTLTGTPTTPDPPAPIVIVQKSGGVPWWALAGTGGVAALLGAALIALLSIRRRKSAREE